MLLNRVKVTSATTGTGTLTLGAPAAGAQSFAAAGAVPNGRYSYVIEDAGAWEMGIGEYLAGTLTRELGESSTGSLLNLTGAAVVFVSPSSADFSAGGWLPGYPYVFSGVPFDYEDMDNTMPEPGEIRYDPANDYIVIARIIEAATDPEMSDKKLPNEWATLGYSDFIYISSLNGERYYNLETASVETFDHSETGRRCFLIQPNNMSWSGLTTNPLDSLTAGEEVRLIIAPGSSSVPSPQWTVAPALNYIIHWHTLMDPENNPGSQNIRRDSPDSALVTKLKISGQTLGGYNATEGTLNNYIDYLTDNLVVGTKLLLSSSNYDGFSGYKKGFAYYEITATSSYPEYINLDVTHIASDGLFSESDSNSPVFLTITPPPSGGGGSSSPDYGIIYAISRGSFIN